MDTALVDALVETVRQHHRRSLTGIEESRASSPEDFERIAGTYLRWCADALGPDALARVSDAFARFSSDVNLAQGRYEIAGRYENRSYEECRRAVYDAHDTMTDYLWGVYLSNFLWVHHLELMRFFEDSFLSRLTSARRVLELAPGHGGWGLWALHRLPQLSLQGHDISATSVEIASRLAAAAGLSARARYTQDDALALLERPSPDADACICCFVVEHLEQPARLLDAIAHALKPGGVAFFTGALTAAQVDHIFEFKRESELVQLAEDAGLRVLQTLSVAPPRRLPKARFVPRSMALILQRRTSEHA